MKKNYIFAMVFLCIALPVIGQTVCQEQLGVNDAVDGSSSGIGQSVFMAGCSGYFDSIELERTDDGGEVSAELKIFNGQTFLGEPRYIQNVTIPQGIGAFAIALDAGTGDLSFFEDNQYTFILYGGSVQFGVSGNIDSYVDGQMFVEVGFINHDDLRFKLNVTSTLGMDAPDKNVPVLYPNPAGDHLQISGIAESEPFSVFNVLGVKVMQGTLMPGAGMDVHALPTGIYLLKLKGQQTLRFVKQ